MTTAFDFGSFVSSLGTLEENLEVVGVTRDQSLPTEALLDIQISQAMKRRMSVGLCIETDSNLLTLHCNFNLLFHLQLTGGFDEDELSAAVGAAEVATLHHCSKIFVSKIRERELILLRLTSSMYIPTTFFAEPGVSALHNLVRLGIPKLINESVCTLDVLRRTWFEMKLDAAQQPPALLN